MTLKIPLIRPEVLLCDEITLAFDTIVAEEMIEPIRGLYAVRAARKAGGRHSRDASLPRRTETPLCPVSRRFGALSRSVLVQRCDCRAQQAGQRN
ncbi:hypothetical protein [Roseovarius indicus]|uniref:hypothetical protein n=1 Tax=Roseovarius indicus TaxID=540747 RepID=UPI0032EC05EB